MPPPLGVPLGTVTSCRSSYARSGAFSNANLPLLSTQAGDSPFAEPLKQAVRQLMDGKAAWVFGQPAHASMQLLQHSSPSVNKITLTGRHARPVSPVVGA